MIKITRSNLIEDSILNSKLIETKILERIKRDLNNPISVTVTGDSKITLIDPFKTYESLDELDSNINGTNFFN